MRIGIDVSASGCKSTGTGRFIDCLLEQLGLSSHKINKFLPGNIALPAIHFTINKYLPLNYQRHLYREFLLKKEMDKEHTDCAIFPDYFLPNNFKLPAAVVIHDLSFITHPHFYSGKFILFYRSKLKNTLSQNPVITTVSENTKNNLITHLGIKEKDIFLLQGYTNIVDKLSHPGGKIQHEPYLLYVGHIEPRKNLAFLIRNFLEWKQLNEVNIKLKIAGELWINSREISELLLKYKNHPDVEIMGYVNEEKLIELYQHAAGYVNSSFVEGFGFPVAEAMKYNIPILCSRGTACEEISAPYSVTVNPYDDHDIVKGLDRLYCLIEQKKRISYNEKYSPSLMQEQLNIIIDKLMIKLNNKRIFYLLKAANIYEAVEKTLLYAQIHKSGIRRDLLHERLLDLKVSEEKINESIIKLYLDGRIYFNNDIIYLNYIPEKYYVNGEKKLKREKINFILKFLSSIPFISGIAFSGGTAHYGIFKHDDVDLFIITKRHTLYISYFIIHVLSLLLKARNEICANYLVDENGLAVNLHRDFYTAHQVISLKAYKNKDLLNLFFEKNEWVLNYFPNFNIIPSRYKIYSKYPFLAPVNYVFFLFYRIIYRHKIKSGNDGVIISKSCLKLHTNDHRVKTISTFEKAWNLYKAGKDKIIMIEKDKKAAVRVLS